MKQLLNATFIGLILFNSLIPAFSQTQAEDYDRWIFPVQDWKDEDFQSRFLGRYGVNGFTEPQMDIENYNIYEGTIALIEDKEKAIEYLKYGISEMEKNGLEASPSLHFTLGSIYDELGKKDLAIEQYITSVKKHPNFLRAYANLGFALMEINEQEKALPVLLKTVELGANESQIHGLIGRIYTDKKLYESALSSFRSAIVFKPENNNARFGIIQCLIALGRYEDAIPVIDEALAFDRNNVDHWHNRAGLLMRLNRIDEAIVDLQTAHHLGGESYTSLLDLSALYFQKELYKDSINCLLNTIPLAKNQAELERILGYANSLVSANQLDGAIAILQKVEHKSNVLNVPMDTYLINKIEAKNALAKHDFAETIRFIAPLIEQTPLDGTLYLMKAKALLGLQEKEEAILSYQIAATINTSAFQANYELARLMLSDGEMDKALTFLRTAYSKKPSDALRDHIRTIEEIRNQR